MATFTSGISWETDEWFRTFSESFPQYTQPGIWIAAEERLASLRELSSNGMPLPEQCA